MELQQLKYFKTVAQMGKISAAAEAMFVSAPALSTSISRLEKELGMPLFDRTNNRITLNRQGEILLRHVNQVFTSLDSAKAELQQSVRQQRQHVSVTALSSNTWFDLVAVFSQEYPQHTLACTSQRISQFLADGLLPQYSFLLADDDCGFHSLEDMDSMPLFQDRLVAMVHPAHPFAKNGKAEMDALMRETLLFSLPDYPLYRRLLTEFENMGFPLENVNTYSGLVVRKMVADGMGVSFSTEHTGKAMPEGLCYVPIAGLEDYWTVRLYWRRKRPLTEEEQQFKDFVSELYAHRNV